MDTDRRRDLGQSDSPGEKSKSGQGVRTSARADNKWFRRWFRRFPVSEQLNMNWPISALRYFDFMLVIRTGRKGLNVPYWESGNWKTCEVQLREEYGACL